MPSKKARQTREFLRRCRRLNKTAPSTDAPETMLYVRSAVAFGDADLCVCLAIKNGMDVPYKEIVRDLFKKHDPSEMDQRLPYHVALRNLKKGLSCLNVTNKLPDGGETKILFIA